MQSIARGQVLGKLHIEHGELDLDNAVEMSGSSKTMRSLGNSEIRGLE